MPSRASATTRRMNEARMSGKMGTNSAAGRGRSPLDSPAFVARLPGMNKDQKTGAVQNIKGRLKEAVGVVSGNKDKESEGGLERAKGSVQKAVGDLRHDVAKKLDR